jgi:4-amino-4-deoxy-L-arabinose transferase-like glycosyltransferase
MEERRISSKGTKTLIVCGVLILAAANSFWMLSKRSLDSHECFVSVTAREMLQSNDWIFPTCNGQPRLNKTPLSYWLVAALAKVTGKVNEFTTRFPNAIFAILSAAAILYFINQSLSFRIAAVSASVWITSLSYFRFSHSGRPDTALAFFVMLCFFCFYAAATSQSRKQQVVYMLIFWVSLGLGMVAKGPAPLPYVFIPLFFYIALERKWKIIPKLLPVTGSIIFLVIMLPWPLAVAHRVNWDLMVWKREFFDRLFGDYAPGHYPIYYYFLMIFKFTTPWFIFLPMALVAPFYKVWNEKRPLMKFLWLWFTVDFLFLTLDAGKRQHYIMPLMPAMAVLIGVLLEDMVFARKAYTLGFAKGVLQSHVMVIVATVIVSTIYIAVKVPAILGQTIVLGIMAIVTVTAVALLLAKRKPAIACTVGFTGLVIWIMTSYASFAALMDENRYTRDFAKTIAEIIPPSGRLVAYKHVSSRFVQYYGKAVPEIVNKSELYKHYEGGDWVICFSSNLKELTENVQMQKIRSEEIIEGVDKTDAGGTLFHKLVFSR